MKCLVAPLGLVLASGCVVSRSADPVSTRKYYRISECAQQSSSNPLRSQCADRFANTELSGSLERLTHLSNHPFLYLTIQGSDDVACHLAPPYDKDQLASLNPGDVITVRGTPTERQISYSARPDDYSSAMTIIFRPCTLIAIKNSL